MNFDVVLTNVENAEALNSWLGFLESFPLHTFHVLCL